MKLKVYLADLTHIGLGVSSEIIPLNIGLIASYAKKVFGDAIEVSLFKHPLQLLDALRHAPPHILGCSNYTWNSNLSHHLTKIAKSLNPDVLTVWGGTNYPFVASKQEEMLRKLPLVDMHTFYEGELTFAEIVERMLSKGKRKQVFHEPIDSCQFISPEDGSFVTGAERSRINHLDSIPSPYVTGILDPFFDESMTPLVETCRGCPFACNFCNAGDDYFNSVNKFNDEYISEELTYIAKKSASKGGRILLIADNNFGMIPHDAKTCEVIYNLKQKYGWPLTIATHTGKNSKERIIEATRLLRDDLSVSLSVQSMNETVLKNIRRDNIRLDDLRAIAEELDSKQHAEIITVLPGETYKSQLDGIYSLLDSNVGYLKAHSFTPLSGTPYKDDDSIEKNFKYATKFRIVVRNFSEIEGERIFDVEEVAVATKDMSFDEYVKIRVYMFLIELCINSKVFKPLLRYVATFNIARSKWIQALCENLERMPDPIKEVFRSFEKETRDELWDTKEELISHFSKSENYQLLIDGDRGGNVMLRHRVWMLSQIPDQWVDEVFRCTQGLIDTRSNGSGRGVEQGELEALKKYILGTVMGCHKIEDLGDELFSEMHYDIPRWMGSLKNEPLCGFKFEDPIILKFYLEKNDMLLLKDAFKRFGSHLGGIVKFLQRSAGKMPYRTHAYVSGESAKTLHEVHEANL